MWPALKAIKALGGSATNDELLDKVIELEHFPDVVQNIMHTERQTKLVIALRGQKPTSERQVHSKSHPRCVGDHEKKATLSQQNEVEQIPPEVRKLYKAEKGKKPKDHQETEDLSPELGDYEGRVVGSVD